MDESDMDVFGEFLHGSDEDDYEDDDYSRPQVQIGDGPPSEIIREKRGDFFPIKLSSLNPFPHGKKNHIGDSR
jgi:hypothetical protein